MICIMNAKSYMMDPCVILEIESIDRAVQSIGRDRRAQHMYSNLFGLNSKLHAKLYFYKGLLSKLSRIRAPVARPTSFSSLSCNLYNNRTHCFRYMLNMYGYMLNMYGTHTGAVVIMCM